MRLQLTRDFYIPKGAQPIECGGTDAAVYIYESAGIPYAIGFHGKAQKPDFHHRFRDADRRAQHIAGYLAGRKEWADIKRRWKKERQTPHTLKVGDILSAMWGYDQTNVDYYQVTRVVGPYSVEIRQIAAKSGPETGFMTAYCSADPGNFVGEPMVKRANHTNCVRITSYASASPWDGKPDRYSWYA